MTNDCNLNMWNNIEMRDTQFSSISVEKTLKNCLSCNLRGFLKIKPSQNREDVHPIITPWSFQQVSWPIIEITMFIKINEFLQNIGIPTVCSCSTNINAEGVLWKIIRLWSSIVCQETCGKNSKHDYWVDIFYVFAWFSVQTHLRLYNKLFFNVFWTEME